MSTSTVTIVSDVREGDVIRLVGATDAYQVVESTWRSAGIGFVDMFVEPVDGGALGGVWGFASDDSVEVL